MKIVVFKPSQIQNYEINRDGVTTCVCLEIGSNYLMLLEEDAAKFTFHSEPIKGISSDHIDWILLYGKVGVLTDFYFSV
jgi:hypothetical protein